MIDKEIQKKLKNEDEPITKQLFTVLGIVMLFVFLYAGLVAGFIYYIYPSIKMQQITQPEVIKPTIKLLGGDTMPNLEFVSATEYTRGDGTGSTIVKLVDFRGDKINTTCWETILYPNKSVYMAKTMMTQDWTYGNYYLDFAVPEPLGIYDQEVICTVNNKNLSIGKGFHVGNLTGMIETNTDPLREDRMETI